MKTMPMKFLIYEQRMRKLRLSFSLHFTLYIVGNYGQCPFVISDMEQSAKKKTGILFAISEIASTINKQNRPATIPDNFDVPPLRTLISDCPTFYFPAPVFTMTEYWLALLCTQQKLVELKHDYSCALSLINVLLKKTIAQPPMEEKQPLTTLAIPCAYVSCRGRPTVPVRRSIFCKVSKVSVMPITAMKKAVRKIRPLSDVSVLY